jgi:hypothetical protein
LRLKKQLAVGRQEHEATMAAYAKEEREIRFVFVVRLS